MCEAALEKSKGGMAPLACGLALGLLQKIDVIAFRSTPEALNEWDSPKEGASWLKPLA
jgi:hypothetical protein